MCGICGIVGADGGESVKAMNELLQHRGPDGVGIHYEPGCSLGHVRLSILDLSENARQPMCTNDGRFWLVFNGEIYNFRELRAELVARGTRFRSSGDGEVLLHGLATQGEDFLSRLNGMFAFAFWDSSNRTLLLVRDRLGIKPVYYVNPTPSTLAFASEIKALLAYSNVDRRPNFDVLQQHLAFCHGCSEKTAFQGVYRLSPGHLIRWREATGNTEIIQYWRTPRETSGVNVDGRDVATQLRAKVLQAVERQLVADVPVGAYLSGGLDSSLIACAAVQGGRYAFDCYTITYASSENRLDQIHSDVPYARRLCKHLSCKLTEVEVAADVVGLLPKLIYHLDEPIADPAAITCYLISRLAQGNGAKVLLSGQGADELFAGYPRYQAVEFAALFRRLPLAVRKALSTSAKWLSAGKQGKIGASMRRIRRVGAQLAADPIEQFLNYCMSSPTDVVQSIWSTDVRNELLTAHPHDACRRTIEAAGGNSLAAFLQRDMKVYLPNHNLLYTDKMSMAVGLEARVPFLDDELVEFALRLPMEQKLAKGQTKIALRNAARGLVPTEIIDRPKAGFGAPFRKWLRYDLHEMWNDLFSRSAVERRGWFDFDAIQRIRQASVSGQSDLYMLQWAILSIELWARAFLDEPVSAPHMLKDISRQRCRPQRLS